MEKIKNIINPGSKKDDNVMYGEGQPGETAPMEGEGSHFGNSRTTAPSDSGLNLSTSAHDQADRPSKAEEVLGGADPMGGASTTREPRHLDDTATTASIKSGVPGQAQTGNTIGSGTHASEQAAPDTATTTTGPHSSSLGNKADPRMDSDLDGRRGLEAPSSTTGTGHTSSALPDRTTQSAGYGDTTGGSDTPNLGRDAALGAGVVGAGGVAAQHHGHNQSDPNVASSESGRSFPLTGGAGTTNTGPHSSSLANKADPSVDSDLDGSRTAGTSGVTGSAPIASQPMGEGNTSPRGYGPEAWERDNHHDHAFKGDPCHGKEEPTPGVVHHISGHHSIDIANALDPNQSSSGSKSGGGLGLGTTGTGRGQPDMRTGAGLTSGSGSGNVGSQNVGDSSRRGNDPALAGATAGAGVGAGAAATGGQRDEPTTTGETLTGPVHGSKMMNTLDPRVNSVGTSEPTSTSGTYDTTPTTSGQKDHHYGRDAGLVGAGAVGAGTAYEVGKDREGYSSEQYPSSGTSGLNDPSRTSGSSGTGLGGGNAPLSTTSGLNNTGAAPMSGTTTSTAPGSGEYPSASGEPTKDHSHLGRDAGIAGAGAGAGGVAAYEAERHLGHGGQSMPEGTTTGTTGTTAPSQTMPTTSSTTGSTTAQPSSSIDQPKKDHHLGRDAGMVGTGGVAAYEADKHLNRQDPSRLPAGSTSAQPSSTIDEPKKDHHLGRDAGMVGAGGVAAYEADKHLNQQDSSRLPADTTTQQPTTYDSTAPTTTGGMTDKEAHKLEKAHEKELAKEQKHQNKELAKEQKQHEKDVAKEHKQHEKDIAKAEKKAEHDAEKHEKKQHGGGILGLFKRDKPDEDLKQEELERKAETGDRTNIPSMAEVEKPNEGMTEAEKHQTAKDHDHQRNRLHKDPPPGYIEKKLAESDGAHGDAPQKGYASNVTGGTGTTALAKGDQAPSSSGGPHLFQTSDRMDPAVTETGDTVRGT